MESGIIECDDGDGMQKRLEAMKHVVGVTKRREKNPVAQLVLACKLPVSNTLCLVPVSSGE